VLQSTSPQIKFLEPMRARPVATLPKDRDKWFYEVKLDGHRSLIGMYGTEDFNRHVRAAGLARFVTRRGNTSQFH
jgi:ATP-dependent DNA ligase